MYIHKKSNFIVYYKCLFLFACLFASYLNAQSINFNAPINNFEHPDWYEGSVIGELGSVFKYGNGNTILAIINADFDQSSFLELMMRNKDKYTMYVFTPSGIGSSIAPVMPKDRDYGKRVWSSAFQNAVIDFFEKKGIKSNINILGFFVLGTQNAVRIATKRPDMFKKLIIVGGTPSYSMGIPLPIEMRGDIVNKQLALRFTEVKPNTWYRGLYPSQIYSMDSITAQRYWEMTAKPTIPTMIQYLCEYQSDDPSIVLEDYKNPILVIIPEFNDKFKKENKRLFKNFNKSWYNLSDELSNLIIEEVKDSKIFIFTDRPKIFDTLLENFLD